jgi:hypothetical protein
MFIADVTRRQLLGVATLGAAMPFVVGAAGDEPAAPPTRASSEDGESTSPGLEMTSVEFRTIGVFAAGFTSEDTIRCPRSITLSNIDAESLSLSLEFDPRLYDVSDGATLIDDDGTLYIETPAPTIISPSRSVLTLQIDRAARRQGDAEVSIPLAPADRYPAEDLAPVTDTTVTVSSAGDSVVRATWGTTSTTPLSRVWGAEVSAGWADVAVSQAGATRQYRVPTTIRCRSVGPQAIPERTVVTVTLDGAITSPPVLASVMIDDEPAELARFGTSLRRDGGAYLFDVTMPDEVAAQSTLMLVFVDPVRRARTEPRVDSLHVATVTLRAPESATERRRSTTSDFAVDISSSGNPLAPDAATGTI